MTTKSTIRITWLAKRASTVSANESFLPNEPDSDIPADRWEAYHKSQDHELMNAAASTSDKGGVATVSQLDQKTSRGSGAASRPAKDFKCIFGEGGDLMKYMITASEKIHETMEKSSKILSRAMIVIKTKDTDEAKEWI